MSRFFEAWRSHKAIEGTSLSLWSANIDHFSKFVAFNIRHVSEIERLLNGNKLTISLYIVEQIILWEISDEHFGFKHLKIKNFVLFLDQIQYIWDFNMIEKHQQGTSNNIKKISPLFSVGDNTQIH